MPTYEYVCLDCKRRFEVWLSYKDYEAYQPTCPHCQSGQVRRRIGRIRLARSLESTVENLSDPTMWEGIEDDPKVMGRMMRKLSSELGEDLGPDFNEVVGRLEAGQSPEEIEAEMPDLGEKMGGMGASDEGDLD